MSFYNIALISPVMPELSSGIVERRFIESVNACLPLKGAAEYEALLIVVRAVIEEAVLQASDLLIASNLILAYFTGFGCTPAGPGLVCLQSPG